jgi:uncharacterized protein
MIATFLALTIAFSVVFDGLVIASGAVAGGAGRYATGAMWGPGFAALITCRLYSIPVATLGWQWGETRFQISSYLLPAAYGLVAYALIWTTGLGSVPSPAFLSDSVAAVGIPSMPTWAAAALMIALNAVFGFIRSCANALGEEIGWRGFLAPRLAERYGFTAASLVSGAIWAVWHYPALLFADYNMGTPAGYALTCFTVMVVSLSVILTWFRLRSGSLWTATFLHASHNLFIQAIFTPLTGNTGPTPYAIDEFGFVLPLVVAAIAVWFWRRRHEAIAAPAIVAQPV